MYSRPLLRNWGYKIKFGFNTHDQNFKLLFSLPPDGRGGWSNDGCYQSLDNSDDNNIVCKCNHLTNFAMLMVSAVYNNHHPTRTVIPHWIMIFRLTCKNVVCRWFLAIFTVFFRQPPECVDLRKCVQ